MEKFNNLGLIPISVLRTQIIAYVFVYEIQPTGQKLCAEFLNCHFSMWDTEDASVLRLKLE